MSDWAPHEDWCEYRKEVSRLQGENSKLLARAVVAEQHKTLSLLGKSSWQEVVEQKLRFELAETQVRAEAAERDLAALREQVRQIRNELIAAASKVRYMEDAQWLYRACDALALLVSEKTQEDHARVDRQPTSERRPTASKE